MFFQEDSPLIIEAVSKRMMENKQGNTLGDFLYKTGNGSMSTNSHTRAVYRLVLKGC
jgi:hypothetical protein